MTDSGSMVEGSWGTTQSASTYSGTSEQSKRRKQPANLINYRWKSYWTFVAIAVSSIISAADLEAFSLTGKSSDITILHHITTFAFVALPLYYMEIILGQYTQLGLTLLKYLSPIGHGISFSFSINLFLKILQNSVLIVDYGIYFFKSLDVELQWLRCRPGSEGTCWNIYSSCKNNCINENVKMSAEIYYLYKFLENPEPYGTHLSLGKPGITKLIILSSVWFLYVILLTCVTSNFLRLRRNILVASLVLVALSLVSLIVSSGQFNGIVKIFSVRVDSLVSLEVWSKSVSLTVNIMALGRAFHVIHGSFMTSQTPSGLLTLSVTLLVFGIVAMFSLLTLTSASTIQKYAHLDKDHMKYLNFDVSVICGFVLIPQAQGCRSIPQVWCAIYFGSILLLLVVNQLSHMVVAEKTVSDSFPSLIKYKKYTYGIICVTCALTEIILIPKEMLSFTSSLLFKMDQRIEAFNCFTLCLIVCWIYGVQKFSDDIHFMSGQQPIKFWKLCWYSLPFITGTSHFYMFYVTSWRTERDIFVMDVIIYTVLISPIPIAAVVETFRYMKRRNLMGLFRPEERYGPPDCKERELRRIYNPRKEIRCRRRREVCKHHCLLDSKILRRVTQEEQRFKKEYRPTCDDYDLDIELCTDGGDL